MSWLKLHDSFYDDPKVLRLAKRLGISQAQAAGHVSLLWSWALRHAKDGSLQGKDADDVAIGAKWDGDPGVFVEAMWSCRLLDESPFHVHNWMDYQGSWKEAVRQQKCRATKTVTTESRDSHDKEERRGEEKRGEERKEKRGDQSTMRTDVRAPSAKPPPKKRTRTKRTYPPRFEEWWKMWKDHPAHAANNGSGPGDKGRAWDARGGDTWDDRTYQAGSNYLDDCLAINSMTQHGSTWLNGDWAEWFDREPRKATDKIADTPFARSIKRTMEWAHGNDEEGGVCNTDGTTQDLLPKHNPG